MVDSELPHTEGESWLTQPGDVNETFRLRDRIRTSSGKCWYAEGASMAGRSISQVRYRARELHSLCSVFLLNPITGALLIFH